MQSASMKWNVGDLNKTYLYKLVYWKIGECQVQAKVMGVGVAGEGDGELYLQLAPVKGRGAVWVSLSDIETGKLSKKTQSLVKPEGIFVKSGT